MRHSVKFLIPFLLVALVWSCDSQPQVEESVVVDDGYDEILAQKLGADDYGMKSYVMAFLKAGPNRDQDSASTAEIQRAHMDNIGRMVEEGTLVLAGPFLDDGELRGIYIFNVATVEDARELTNTDPAVKAGRLIMELHPWYGSAALQEVSKIGKRLAKESI